MSYVRDFAQLRVSDAEQAGGKGANLGELTGAELPVPPGFVVLREAYLDSMERAGVRAELAAAHAEAMSFVDDTDRLTAASERMRELVLKAGVCPQAREEVLAAYRELGGDLFVAVRSSATGEDGADASFAGMNATFTNVRGAEDLLVRVVDCWASLFGARVVAYRASRGFTAEPAIAVVVQKMVASERSGVAFTADPSTGDVSRIVVEGAFGLGEVVVSGSVEPDTYVLAKDGLRVLTTRVGRQAYKLVRGPDGGDVRIDLDEHDGHARVLSDVDVIGVARLAKQVEEHYGSPQDVEWAIENGRIWLVQARPITTLGTARLSRTRARLPTPRCW